MIAIIDSLLCFTCLWAARTEHTRLRARREATPLYPILWVLLALVLGLLALQEVTGILGAITDAARHDAMAEGWYGERRPFQWLLIKAVPIAAALAGGGALWIIRRSWQRYLLAVAATLYWVSFAIIQGISFHNIDWLLRQRTLGLYNKTWGDLLGMVLTAAALLFMWSSDRRLTPYTCQGRAVSAAPSTLTWTEAISRLGRSAAQGLGDEGRIFIGWYLRFRDRRRRDVSTRKR